MAQNTEMGKAIPPQKQEQHPGIEAEMTPKPTYIRADYKGSEKLINKRAIITGGDSGIGRSVAVHFAKEGADIVISYLNETEDAQATKRLVEAEGRKCYLVPSDLRDQQACFDLVAKATQQLGGLDILVLNHAEQHQQTDFTDISSQQLESTFRTNIISFFYIAQAAKPHLKEGSSIIVTTSVTAFAGSAGLVDYASTKGAILAFGRSLAAQLVKEKIRVNCVAPGPIWTPFIPSTFPPAKVAAFGRDVPMGRPGQPAEVGPAFVFLASEDGSYFVGQTLHPNGGESY